MKKPPISYYGGKQRMAHNIIPLIPKHTVYVEPFAGGAAVFFMKPWPNIKNSNHYREVINDSSQALMNFYRVLQQNGEELINRLLVSPYSKQQYTESKDLEIGDDKIEAACRYFINTNQSFANVINGGWGKNIYGPNSAYKWANKIKDLDKYLERMVGVYIDSDDAINVIKNWDSPQTFFYCDPPYPETNQGHYRGYRKEDFTRLIQTLDSCQGSFILSNYEQPDTEIPTDWERHTFSAKCTAKKRIGHDHTSVNTDSTQGSDRTEVIWRRLAQTTPRKEILELYNSGMFDCFKG